MEKDYLLRGLSKDKVILIKDNVEHDKIFVRKTSQNIETSSRLSEQYEFIYNWSDDAIRVPKLLKEGNDLTGKYFYEMEFLNSPSLAHIINYPTNQNIRQTKKALEMLLDYFDRSLNSQLLPKKQEVLDKFSEKIVLLNIFFNNIKKNNLDPKVLDILNLLVNYFNKLSFSVNENILNRAKYKVHGDLTFSNMLMGKDNLYFIDLNKHFLGNTILSDISKLFFDIDYCLSLKLEKNIFELEISTLNNLDKFKDKFLDLINKHIDYFKYIKDLSSIIESFRVLQYVINENNKLANNLQEYIIEKSETILKENILCQL